MILYIRCAQLQYTDINRVAFYEDRLIAISIVRFCAHEQHHSKRFGEFTIYYHIIFQTVVFGLGQIRVNETLWRTAVQLKGTMSHFFSKLTFCF